MRRFVNILVIAGLVAAMAAPIGCGGPSPKAGDYPRPRLDVRDISFYQPSAKMAPYPVTRDKKVENVILCIGDGMGLTQVAMARLRAVGENGRLYMERLPVAGLVRTHSADSLVTDSAAGGTALACGVKTNNGMIGMTPDEQAYRTVLELARAKGMATGLVVTSSITHATPASFASHVKSRKMETRIAEHLINNRVNVLFGGGRQFFLPRSNRSSARKDHKDLVREAQQAGYVYIETPDQLGVTRHTHLLGLFQLEGLTTEPPEPTLAELTRKAIDALQDAKDEDSGFFMMVEGSQIDWACHDNDADNAVRQVLLFDQAVEVAADFALSNERTLVIVVADHETGGLTLTDRDAGGVGARAQWSTKGHTGTPVPVYAMGPGAEMFAGVYDNTEVAKKIAQLLGIRPFPQPME